MQQPTGFERKAARFDKASPPRVEVQFQVDAKALADAAEPPVKLDQAVRKWEIVETVPDAELRFKAVVPRNPKEVFAAKDHVSDPAGMIVQRPRTSTVVSFRRS